MLRFTTLAFLGALALTVVCQALTGRIRLGGLLRDHWPGAGPARRPGWIPIQLLAVTFLAAAAYLVTASPPQVRPLALSVGFPVAVGVSNFIFLWSQYRHLQAASHS